MNTVDIIANKDQMRANEIAESIRRLTAPGIALLIENLLNYDSIKHSIL